MPTLNAPNALIALSQMEQHARIAREALVNGLEIQRTKIQRVMASPGHPGADPRVIDQQIAQLFNQFGACATETLKYADMLAGVMRGASEDPQGSDEQHDAAQNGTAGKIGG